ncbi:MAG: hypothetical protein N2745_02610 [Syntrophorhabdaceae bacterium]|nr:hypothetical protein [Syntrophorhabdaceae bacterium]
MKKNIRLISIILLFSSVFISCAHLQRKKGIEWPSSVDYMEALGNIHMSWRGMEYNGTMAVKVRYPDTFRIEIYGPFGETQVMIDKKGDDFLFTSRDEIIRDEKMFEKRFGITLGNFMEDITLRHYRDENSDQPYVYVKREGYLLMYELKGLKDRICWKGGDGSICLSFIEANFHPSRGD